MLFLLRPMCSQCLIFRYHFWDKSNRYKETLYTVWKIDILTILLDRFPVKIISEIYMHKMVLTPSTPKITLFSVHCLAKLGIGYWYKTLLLIVETIENIACLVLSPKILFNHDNSASVCSHCHQFHHIRVILGLYWYIFLK